MGGAVSRTFTVYELEQSACSFIWRLSISDAWAIVMKLSRLRGLLETSSAVVLLQEEARLNEEAPWWPTDLVTLDLWVMAEERGGAGLRGKMLSGAVSTVSLRAFCFLKFRSWSLVGVAGVLIYWNQTDICLNYQLTKLSVLLSFKWIIRWCICRSQIMSLSRTRSKYLASQKCSHKGDSKNVLFRRFDFLWGRVWWPTRLT